MKSLVRVALIFVSLTISNGVSAGDFSDSFDRVQQVWDNVTSFQANAWTAINDSLSASSADPADNFFNNVAPQEITDATKIALTQIFPGIGSAVGVADKVDQYAARAQSRAQSNLNSPGQNITGLLGDYFGGSAGGSPKGGEECSPGIWKDGICPPCPSGSVRAGSDHQMGCVSTQAECPSGSVHVASGPGCISTGLENDGDDAKYLSQNSTGAPSLRNALSNSIFGGKNTATTSAEGQWEVQAGQAAAQAASGGAQTTQQQWEAQAANAATLAIIATAPAPPPSSPRANKVPPSPAKSQSCPYKLLCEQCLDQRRSELESLGGVWEDPRSQDSYIRGECQAECTPQCASMCVKMGEQPAGC